MTPSAPTAVAIINLMNALFSSQNNCSPLRLGDLLFSKLQKSTKDKGLSGFRQKNFNIKIDLEK
jgi:hypothetical protein